VSAAVNAASAEMHRREADVVQCLPRDAPVPRLLAAHDEDGWMTLVFEDVDGRQPALPWRGDELVRVLDALEALWEALTPAPLATPTVADGLAAEFTGWRTVDPDAVDAWARRHLDGLVAREERWTQAAAGETLLHSDLRADNLLLTPDRVVVVDWPSACVGAAWVDLAFLLPSVAMQGGPRPETVLASTPTGVHAPSEQLDAVVAALAGYFVEHALRPPPPGLPTVRAFQAAQGRVALDWLRARTGWR
jgi:thiamine kinase-like enzyme